MSDVQFYKKLYRLDNVDFSWDSLKTGAVSSAPKPPPFASPDALKAEYLQAVFKPEAIYSYPKTEAAFNDGVVTEKTTPVFFQVMQLFTQQGRQRRIPTMHDDEDVLSRSRVAMSVQYMELWGRRADVDVSATVYFDSEPFYVNILDLVPFKVATTELKTWDTSVSDSRDCIDVINPVLVHTLFDPQGDCPVYVPLAALKDMGWVSQMTTVVHTAASPKSLDRRASSSKLLYYQVLLNLPALLDVNPSIPSDQPQTYYAVVSYSIKTEPGLGAAHYRTVLKHFLMGKPLPVVLNDEMLGDVPLAILDAGHCDEESDGDDGFEFGGRAAVGKARAAAKPKALLDRPVAKPPPRVAPEIASSSSGSSSKSSTSSSSSSDSDASSDDSFQMQGMGTRGEQGEWVQISGGPLIKIEKYMPKGKRAYQRLIAKGCCHGHLCIKKRNVTHTARYGKVEPIAFLAAWWELGRSCTKNEHTKRTFRVPVELVETWTHRLDKSADPLLARY
jgi:hypothetical protein